MIKYLFINLILTSFLLTGCAGVNIGGVGLGSVARIAEKTYQATTPLSDEEEYYVGRAVAARILSSYPLLEDKELTEYVNLVGQTVAIHSDEPFTYGGYHFGVLDSNEMNAFACPGGMIFITKGMISSATNEDELASVLAHEVAHINNRDGASSIQKARLTEVATLISTEAAKRYTPAELSQLVKLFEGSVDDVFKTVVVNGYSKSQEYSADKDALNYLSRAGYDPQALITFLERLIAQEQGLGGGLMKTHPAMIERLENVAENLPSKKGDEALVNLRSKRFEKAIK
ncbi:M48 family metalloprotease [Desulfobacterota bacterium AH_259_B03_O07]|nr:M48 family metalloprotease [Desulfobacterota bacterium AH_259_B03_O07]